VWRKGHDNELYELFNESDIVEYIKINRLGWTGYDIPMVTRPTSLRGKYRARRKYSTGQYNGMGSDWKLLRPPAA
jgi:hypothetical protein